MSFNTSFKPASWSIILLRTVLAGIFLSHAVTRIMLNTISQFGDFLGSKGLPMGTQIVWAITVFEIAGGILLLLGFFQKWISIGFIIMLLVGIGLIHIHLGWFNGEFGTGGCEYSVTLIAGLVVVASAKRMVQTKGDLGSKE